MPEIVKVAAIQMESIVGSKEANINKAEQLIRKAAQEGAKLICLPELFLTGYTLSTDQFCKLAEEADGPMGKYFCELTAELGIFLIVPFPELSGNDLYNSALLISNGEIKGVHRKVYLWGNSEKRIFKPGNGFQPVHSKWGNIGILICADAEYPEPSRILATKGTDIIFVPSVWSKQAKHRWDVFLPAIALFNLCYVVGVNTFGKGIRGGNCGNSKVIDPYGQVICEAPTNEETVLIAAIDIENVRKARKELPYLQDIRTNIIFQKASTL